MEDLSEKEQLEQIRSWWSDYGNYVVAGVVLGALGLFGYNYYHDSRGEAAIAASAMYGELTDLVVEEKLDEAEALSATLIADYPDSAYASQARLAMARLYMDQNRDADAADMLNDLLGSGANDEYQQVARLRLAKIYLYQDKPDEAIALLGPAGDDDGAFAARYDEVRGDAYVALDRVDEARDAYRRALTEAGRETTVNQEFVQLKLLDLPVEDEPGADPAAGDVPAEDVPAGDEPAGDDPVDAGPADAGPDAGEESADQDGPGS